MNENSIVYVNSEFVPLSQAKISIMDRGFLYGDGLFETLRAYDGQVFKLNEHLARMGHSANALKIPIPMELVELGRVVQTLLEKNNLKDAIVRITLTRGVSDHGILIEDSSPTLVLFARPIGESLQCYETGVSIVLVPGVTSALPGISQGIKSCNFLSQILLRENARQKGAFEAIALSDDNLLTEGSVSNVFLVKDGILKTPALTSCILPGITRQTILEIASAHKIECMETELMAPSLYSADEVFIVNTGWEIMPVLEVDGRRIGSDVPGLLTRRIHFYYRKIIEALNDPC